MSPHFALWLAINGACLSVAVGFPGPAAAIDVNVPHVNIPRPSVTVTPSIPRPSVTVPLSHQRVITSGSGVVPVNTPTGNTSSNPSTGVSGPDPGSRDPGRANTWAGTSGRTGLDPTSTPAGNASSNPTTGMSGPDSPSNQTAGRQTVSAKPSAPGGSPSTAWTNGCGSRGKVANCRQTP